MSGNGQSHKREKFEHSLLNDINMIIRTQLSDARLKFVSVTKVELSKDYAYANVYWDTFDAPSLDEIRPAIDSIVGKIRSTLAKKLNIRHVPELRFQYDNQFDEQSKIEKLLDSAKPTGESSEEN